MAVEPVQVNASQEAVDYKAAVVRAIDALREKKKVLREARRMFREQLEKAPGWMAADVAETKAKQNKKTALASLMQDKFVSELGQKAKDQAEEVKEAKEFLSAYLDEYQRRTGEKVIIDSSGTKLEIVKQLTLRI